MILSNKDIDWDNEDFQRGVRYALESLESLQNKFFHKKEWCISHDLNFAPIEIRDYLLLKARKDAR